MASIESVKAASAFGNQDYSADLLKRDNDTEPVKVSELVGVYAATGRLLQYQMGFPLSLPYT